jgi:hypothetical protein
MKTGLKILAVLFLGLLLSCQGEETDKTTSDDVKEEISEAADATKEYAAKEYKELMSEFNEFTAETDGKISNMQNEIDEMGDDVKAEYSETLGEIKNKNNDLKNKLEEYKEAGKEEKNEIEAEIKELQSDIKASIETFQEKRKEDK